MRLSCFAACVAACCLASALANAAPPEVAGCAKCHGENGFNPKGEVPTIAGMSEAYLEAQMSAYQKGQRPCAKMSGTDMCEVAKKAGSAQTKSTATYYASQKFVAAMQTIDAALAAKGKALHQAHCGVCHSSGGGEPADDAGILAGQWQAYLRSSLEEYAAGKRAQPDNMKRQMAQLSPEAIAALTAFYASEGSK